MTTFKKLCVLMGLALPAIAIGGVMNLFSGFKVEREVLIDPDHSHHPLALLGAAGDGYFVLEDGYGNGIVKVDSNGHTRWTYREPDPGIFLDHPGTAVEFTAAASAPDGGVLIGGHRGKAGEHGVDKLGGVLIRLDKDGHVVGRVDPIQRPDQRVQLFDVYAVSRWGDGFAVIGSADRKKVLLRLRDDGSIVWTKVLEMHGAADSQRTEARSMPNGDLVFRGFDSFARINVDGDVLQEVGLDGSCVWVSHAKSSDKITFLCKTSDDQPSSIPYLLDQDSEGMDGANKNVQKTMLPRLKERAGAIGLGHVYDNVDGVRILFGASFSDLKGFVPTVVELGADQSVIARKEFVGQNEEGITDGMPTGLPGEYVVIRPVLRGKACTAMTFIRRR